MTAKYVYPDNLGDASGSAFAVDWDQLPLVAQQPPGEVLVSIANLGTNISYSGNALNSETPREPLPGEDPVPSAPQPWRLRTKGFPLPTTFRVGLAYDLVTSSANRFTMLADFNQPNDNKAGFSGGLEWMSKNLGGSAFGAAIRGSLLQPRQQYRALDDQHLAER